MALLFKNSELIYATVLRGRPLETVHGPVRVNIQQLNERNPERQTLPFPPSHVIFLDWVPKTEYEPKAGLDYVKIAASLGQSYDGYYYISQLAEYQQGSTDNLAVVPQYNPFKSVDYLALYGKWLGTTFIGDSFTELCDIKRFIKNGSNPFGTSKGNWVTLYSDVPCFYLVPTGSSEKSNSSPFLEIDNYSTKLRLLPDLEGITTQDRITNIRGQNSSMVIPETDYWEITGIQYLTSYIELEISTSR